MNRYRHMVGTAMFALLLCAGAASAQTVANVTVVSGNGQLICPGCLAGATGNPGFQPMVVKLTDANGQAVAGAPVLWFVNSGDFLGTLSATQTVSDANGIATNTFNYGFQGGQFTSLSNLFVATGITANAGNSTATFTLTQALQALPDQTFGSLVPPLIVASLQDDTSQPLFTGSVLSGQAGTTGAPPIRIRVATYLTSVPVPNVAVTLVNNQQSPTVLCATQAGAGANTVLTDSTGIATCNPVYGGVGNGTAYVAVGGGYPLTHLTDPTVPPTPFAFFPNSGSLVVQVTPGAPAAIKLISGNPQSAQAGAALGAPLVVELDSSAGTGLSGQVINWTISPATAGSLGTGATTTDANGQTSNSVRFAATANGAVQVTASSATDPTKTYTFSLTAIPNVTFTGLQIISGNGQSAIVNTTFGSPLVVQLGASGGSPAGFPVQFSISGPANLSATTVNTNSAGQAQVIVQAGATAGAVTVTASASGFTQTFNLTVSPPGPQLQSNSFLNGADFQLGALSPCSIATIIAPGLAPGLQGMVSGSLYGPLPYQLANDRVTVGGSAAPLYSVGINARGQEQLTFQVPCDVTPGSSVPVIVNVGAGSGTVNIPIQAASPGLFLTQMTDGVSRAVLVRPDGSFVSLQNPARRGENVVAFVTGLGPSNPPVGTNSVAAPGSVVAPLGTVVVGMAGGGVPLISTQLSSDLVGLWEVTFTVPGSVSTGNVSFSISLIPSGASSPISSGTTTIPVQ